VRTSAKFSIPSAKFSIPLLVAAALLAGCGNSSKSSSASSNAPSQAATTGGGEGSSAVVKTATNSKVGGTVLVDAQGMTLYRLSAERAGRFICTSSPCLQVWHPLSGSTAGASVSSLGTVKRPDGTEQVAYKGMPLYTFAQDRAPGEANGQGLKDVGTWNAVTVPATASSAPAATTSTPAPTTTSPAGRYGY
jgi:predicted lipoprotein with Yx(FWY)xxD motif